jgi:hypothetical protein
MDHDAIVADPQFRKAPKTPREQLIDNVLVKASGDDRDVRILGDIGRVESRSMGAHAESVSVKREA